jgi:hypothetical protein
MSIANDRSETRGARRRERRRPLRAALKTARDQLRVDMHLAGMDLRTRLDQLEARARRALRSMERTLTELRAAREELKPRRRMVDVGGLFAPPAARRRG